MLKYGFEASMTFNHQTRCKQGLYLQMFFGFAREECKSNNSWFITNERSGLKKSSIKGQAQNNKVEQVQQIINWLIQLHEVRHVEKDNVLSRMLHFIFLFNFGGEANSEMILFLKKNDHEDECKLVVRLYRKRKSPELLQLNNDN